MNYQQYAPQFAQMNQQLGFGLQPQQPFAGYGGQQFKPQQQYMQNPWANYPGGQQQGPWFAQQATPQAPPAPQAPQGFDLTQPGGGMMPAYNPVSRAAPQQQQVQQVQQQQPTEPWFKDYANVGFDIAT